MRNLTPQNITDAFQFYINQQNNDPCDNNREEKGSTNPKPTTCTPNPRTIDIMTCLAKHLHAFANEIELTHEEWNQGLEFIKQVANMTTPSRDEFVLLSDVMGLSSLVDMINNIKRMSSAVAVATDMEALKDGTNSTQQTLQKIHPSALSETSPEPLTREFAVCPTSSSVLGPFHLNNPPQLTMGTDLKRDNGGELVLVQGTILDGVTGRSIPGATVNVWQTAPNGLYSSQDDHVDQYNFHGNFSCTGEDGKYFFTTAKPVPYQIPTDGPVGVLLNALGRHAWRPSHLHYIVKANGYNTLVTELFPSDDPYLNGDAVFGVRDDLVLKYTRRSADAFPKLGFDLSGKVRDDFLQVDFNLVLVPIEDPIKSTDNAGTR